MSLEESTEFEQMIVDEHQVIVYFFGDGNDIYKYIYIYIYIYIYVCVCVRVKKLLLCLSLGSQFQVCDFLLPVLFLLQDLLFLPHNAQLNHFGIRKGGYYQKAWMQVLPMCRSSLKR